MNLDIIVTAITHTLYGSLRSLSNRTGTIDEGDRDRGAVSLEQVLWFVASGVAVAVIAAIIWAKIKTEANAPIQRPAAP